ncbi:DUF3710 domain-containing protein [Streptomyces prunicolor]
MSRAQTIAKEIVEQYGRDGRLSDESLALAEFGVWNRTTPGMLLVMTGCLAALQAPELVERERESGNEVLATILKDDDPLGALALTDAGAELGWDHWVSWIWTYWQSQGMSLGALDELLEQADEVWTEVVDSGDVTRPCVRDGECGPWDVSETPVPADTERIDYGVLKIPRLEGAEPRPLYASERVVGVITDFGEHAFSLEVFRTPHGGAWDMLRSQMTQMFQDKGGSAEEAENSLGPEILAQAPGLREGQQVMRPTRVVGCDGPGWLLRGALRGPEALAAVVEPRVRHLFTQTVVDLSAAPPAATEEVTAVEIRWPTAD